MSYFYHRKIKITKVTSQCALNVESRARARRGCDVREARLPPLAHQSLNFDEKREKVRVTSTRSGGSGLSHTQVTIKHRVCRGSARERHFTHFCRSLEKVCDQRESDNRSLMTDQTPRSHSYESQALQIFISVCLYSHSTPAAVCLQGGVRALLVRGFPQFPWSVLTLSVCLTRFI